MYTLFEMKLRSLFYYLEGDLRPRLKDMKCRMPMFKRLVADSVEAFMLLERVVTGRMLPSDDLEQFDGHVGDCCCQVRATFTSLMTHHFQDAKRLEILQFTVKEYQRILDRITVVTRDMETNPNPRKSAITKYTVPMTWDEFFAANDICLPPTSNESEISARAWLQLMATLYTLRKFTVFSGHLTSLRSDADFADRWMNGLRKFAGNQSTKFMLKSLQLLPGSAESRALQLLKKSVRSAGMFETAACFSGFHTLHQIWCDRRMVVVLNVDCRCKHGKSGWYTAAFQGDAWPTASLSPLSRQQVAALPDSTPTVVINSRHFKGSWKQSECLFRDDCVECDCTPVLDVKKAVQSSSFDLSTALFSFFAVHPQFPGSTLEEDQLFVQEIGGKVATAWQHCYDSASELGCNRDDMHLFAPYHVLPQVLGANLQALVV
eukprot:TRINITY_DN11464_c0_g1_i1.p1 TRINITY_DN11464_c0_g1~~TRINITY_DN11464_c0_g1_i1.p1  ORF type:complete len:433 (+),score=78.05 TRINITY_DN11464_c0_g1_i1:71-1369(+)